MSQIPELPFRRVAFVMHYNWRFLFQRPHHLAQRFREAGVETVVFEVSGIRSHLQNLLSPEAAGEQLAVADRIWSTFHPHGLVRRFPSLAPILEAPIRRSFDRFAARWIDDETLLWIEGVTPALPPERILRSRRRLAILDVSDDIAGFFEGDPEAQARLLACEDEAVRSVDGVVVTASRIHERISRRNPHTLLVRNGVSQRFLDAGRAALERPPSPAERPLVAYQGAIAEWFDFELVEAVVDALPDHDFAFMGRVLPGVAERVARLAARPNVRMLGMLPHHELPSRLVGASCGIIPFRINDLILSTDPIKLYEYLGCGLPVVATPMPEVAQRAEGGAVETAGDAGAFADAVRRAAACRSDRALVERRLALAGENGWDGRFRDLCRFLASRASAPAGRAAGGRAG